MGQVTLYMDEDTLARMRSAAEAAGVSMSAWLAQLVRERTRTEWPHEVAALAGAWRSMPSAEELRGNQPADVARNVREFGRVPGLTVQDWFGEAP